MKREPEEIEQVACNSQEHCLTCGDIALSVCVERVDGVTQIALVRQDDSLAEVDVSLIDIVAPGDWLLVHGGVAIAVDPVRREQ